MLQDLAISKQILHDLYLKPLTKKNKTEPNRQEEGKNKQQIYIQEHSGNPLFGQRFYVLTCIWI
ncbi:hypothetical protein Hanom_Chr16g01432071 [Helianthus anomalus]